MALTAVTGNAGRHNTLGRLGFPHQSIGSGPVHSDIPHQIVPYHMLCGAWNKSRLFR